MACSDRYLSGWLRVLATGAFVYGVYVGAMHLLQAPLIFPGRGRDEAGDERPPSDAQVWWLEIGGGERVEGWFFPAPDAAGPAPAVIAFHGNGDRIDHGAPTVDAFRGLGFAVLLVEYRGYGRSGGTPSTAGIVADALAFYDRLAARPEVDARRIVAYGYSLGAAVAAQVADRRAVAALILESPFRSLAAMARRHGVLFLFTREPLATDAVLLRLDAPVLIFHGTDDPVIPVSHGRALAALGRRVTYVEYAGGHGTIPDWHAHVRALASFLRAWGIVPTAGAQAP